MAGECILALPDLLIRSAWRNKCSNVTYAQKVKINANVTGSVCFAKPTTTSGFVKMAITTAEIAGKHVIIALRNKF